MSLLEDRILRIIELKGQGYENEGIARLMELREENVNSYYNSTKESLTKFARSRKNLERISSEINFSPIATRVLLEHYKIGVTRKHEIQKQSYQKNVQKIIKLAEEGKSVYEMQRALQLCEQTIRRYIKREKIQLIKRSYVKNIQKISELSKTVTSVEEIAIKLKIAISTVRAYAKQQNIVLPIKLYANDKE